MSGGLDTPVYHLDGVVHTKSERENFDGPLDLILSLLSKNKMEIEEIQLSLILEQYLAWMNQRQELNLEVASEFVTMAAHLAYIKTRMLLSLQDEEAVSEMEELIASLEERKRSESYEKIRQAMPLLRERYAVGKDYLSKPAEPIQRERAYRYQHQPDDLPKALQRILRRRQEQSPPAAAAFEGIVRREPYPVAEKVHEILTGLAAGVTPFRALFRRSRSRSEVVATFLAVLELCRQKRIYLAGGDRDCTVARTGEQTQRSPEEKSPELDGQDKKNGEMWK